MESLVHSLIWKKYKPNHFRALAPVFGYVHVKKKGDIWVVNYSVPGFSGSYISGQFKNDKLAKIAAQKHYDESALECSNMTPQQKIQKTKGNDLKIAPGTTNDILTDNSPVNFTTHTIQNREC